jgi:hypothetical protein
MRADIVYNFMKELGWQGEKSQLLEFGLGAGLEIL